MQGVAFNSKPNKPNVYSNKRTEIYGELRDWILQDGGVDIPDNPIMINELLSIPDFKINSNGQYVMEAKDEIKKVIGKSPDIADAMALTFSDNIPILEDNDLRDKKIKVINNYRR